MLIRKKSTLRQLEEAGEPVNSCTTSKDPFLKLLSLHKFPVLSASMGRFSPQSIILTMFGMKWSRDRERKHKSSMCWLLELQHLIERKVPLLLLFLFL